MSGGGQVSERLLTSGEVAGLLGACPQTVARWADDGRLESTRTLGGPGGPGHRRFRETDILAWRAGTPPERSAANDAPGGDGDRLLTSAETAALFRVDPRTVARWVRQGKIRPARVPGRYRRYRESEVRALLAAGRDGTAQ